MPAEFEHVVDGSHEIWDDPSTPRHWTVVTSGTGTTINQDTTEKVDGASSLRCERTTSAGTAYVEQTPRQPLIPGMYYRIQLSRMTRVVGTLAAMGGPASQGARLVNVTRNSSLFSNAQFSTGVTAIWAQVPSNFFKAYSLWFRIPETYGPSDDWKIRNGLFTTNSVFGSSWFDGVSLKGPYIRPLNVLGLSAAGLIVPTRLQFMVTLISPTGAEYDITSRIAKGGIGSITEAAEESLLEITHGDLSLTCRDTDGFLAGLLAGSEATDRWEIVIERETGKRRLKWDRLFAGVLDLPWSVTKDPREKTITFQVFSYTKLLERASAEAIQRSFTGRTGTVSAGSATVTMNSTTDLVEGDEVTLDNGSGTTETQTVLRVNSATQWTAASNFTSAFTNAAATLATPYYRQRSPESLAIDLFSGGGIEQPTIDMSASLAAYPVPTPACSLGLGGYTPVTLLSQGGLLKTHTVPGRMKAADPRSAFVLDAATTAIIGDWSAYHLTEPGTLASRSGTFGSVQDAGAQAWNHAAGIWYEVVPRASGAPPTQSHFLELKNHLGTVLATVDTWVGNASGGHVAAVEYDPVNDRVWVTYKRAPEAPSALEETVWYQVGTWTKNVIVSTYEGSLRVSRKLNRMFSAGTVTSPSTTVKEWSLATTPALLATRTLPAGCLLWTLRGWDTVIGIVARPTVTNAFVHLFDAATWNLVSSVTIPGPYTQNLFSTVFPDPIFGNVLIVSALNRWLVFSKGYAGVVPYANWDGLSIAGALKELAKITVSYLAVDRYNSGSLLQRLAVEAGTVVADLGTPLNRPERTIWEHYYRSVRVTFTDAAGVQQERIAGDRGASGSRLDVDPKLVDNDALADSIGAFYLVYVSQLRAQAEALVREGEETVRPLDLVTMDDRTWLVADSRMDPVERELTLRLFEVP